MCNRNISIPQDFHIELSTRGLLPTTSMTKLYIESTGLCRFFKQLDQRFVKATEKEFRLEKEKLEHIYDIVKNSNFFKLTSHDSGTFDGDQIQVSITLAGKTHTVLLINYPLKDLDDMIEAINRLLPKEFNLRYNSIIR